MVLIHLLDYISSGSRFDVDSEFFSPAAHDGKLHRRTDRSHRRRLRTAVLSLRVRHSKNTRCDAGLDSVVLFFMIHNTEI